MHAPLKSGLKPVLFNHKDLSFFKTKKFGGTIPSFPETVNVDAGIWNPDQDEPIALFTPPCPALPEGCTDFSGTDLCIDQDKVLHDPQDVENITHANADGGGSMRAGLTAAGSLWGNRQPFAVQPDIQDGGVIDFFDAVRLAIVLQNNASGVSIGSPFFPEWMTSTQSNGIMPEPNWSLTVPGTSVSRVSWHNWNVKGWITINGVVYLICKMWIGPTWGNNGYGYISREIFTTLMEIPGCAAFNLYAPLPGETPWNIESSIKQLLLSFFYQIFGLNV